MAEEFKKEQADELSKKQGLSPNLVDAVRDVLAGKRPKAEDEAEDTVQEAKAVEGNAFTKALNAARENGDKTFMCAGKKYDTKTEQELDPVNKTAVKKKFKNRKDKDIDNDGDVDDSDEYLHKRRKAVTKAVANEARLKRGKGGNLPKHMQISRKEIVDVIGKTQNAGQAVSLLQKKFKISKRDAESVMKSMMESGEVNEVELKKSEYFAVKTGRMTVKDLAKKYRTTDGAVRGEINLMKDHERRKTDAWKNMPESVEEGKMKAIDTANQERKRLDPIAAKKKLQKMKPKTVSFHHHTGPKISGTYKGIKNMGGRPYAKVEVDKNKHPKHAGGHLVPTHQIHQVHEDVDEMARRGRPPKSGVRKSDDMEAGKHIVMQLRKSVSLRGQHPVEFKDGKTVKISSADASKALNTHNKLRTPAEKETFMNKLHHSHDSFKKALKDPNPGQGPKKPGISLAGPKFSR